MKSSVLLALALGANTSLGQDDPNPPPGPTENRVIVRFDAFPSIADRYYYPGEAISLNITTGVIQINIFSDTSGGKPLVNIGPVSIQSSNTRTGPLLVFLGAGTFPFFFGARTPAGVNWSGIGVGGTLAPTTQNPDGWVRFTGAISGELTGNIDVSDVIQFDAGTMRGGVFTSGANGMGWIRAGSFTNEPTISAAKGNITLIEALTGDIRCPILANNGSIAEVRASAGNISITASAGLRAKAGIGSIRCLSMTGNITTNFEGGSGDLGRLWATAGGYSGTINAARLKSTSFSEGLRLSGNFIGTANFTGNVEQEITAFQLVSGSTINIGGSLATTQSVLVADPAGLKGQVVINRSNSGGQWTAPVVVGSGSTALSPLPAYSKPSSQVGGGAIGLVPFQYYASDSVPLGASDEIANNHPVLSSALNAGGEIKVGFYGPVRASNSNGSPVEVGIIVPNQNVYMRVTDRFDIVVRPPTGGSESRFVTIKGKSGAVYGSGLYYITQNTLTGGARLVCDIPGSTPPSVATFGHYFLVKRDCNADGIADATQRVPIGSNETFEQCNSSTPPSGLFRDCEPDGVLDVCPTLNGRCYADMNFDCNVDDTDFQIFVAAYTQVYSCIGDFDGDGNTDDADFVIFTKFYDTLVCAEGSCMENLFYRAAICGEQPPTP